MFHLLVLTTTLSNVLRIKSCTASSTVKMALQAADFEVFGRVQGVFFRKYTKQQADKLGLRGWCLNTSQGTVQGHMEGPQDKVNAMMQWLRNTGSPSSQIDKAEFRNQKEITDYGFEGFDIRRDR